MPAANGWPIGIIPRQEILSAPLQPLPHGADSMGTHRYRLI